MSIKKLTGNKLPKPCQSLALNLLRNVKNYKDLQEILSKVEDKGDEVI